MTGSAKQSTKPRRKLDCFASLEMTKGHEPILSRHDLIADDEEFDQVHPPKTRGQRHVGGVAPGAHQDAADPWAVVAGVGCVGHAAQTESGTPRGKKPSPV